MHYEIEPEFQPLHARLSELRNGDKLELRLQRIPSKKSELPPSSHRVNTYSTTYTTPRKIRTNSYNQQALSAVDQISNLQDKVQIHDALSSITDVHGKLRLVDLILERREDQKLAKRKKKLARGASEQIIITPISRGPQSSIIPIFSFDRLDSGDISPLKGSQSALRFPERIGSTPKVPPISKIALTPIDNIIESEGSDSSDRTPKLVFPEVESRNSYRFPTPALSNRSVRSSKALSNYNFNDVLFTEPTPLSHFNCKKSPSTRNLLNVPERLNGGSSRQMTPREDVSMLSIKIKSIANRESQNATPLLNIAKNKPNLYKYSLAGKTLEKDLYRFLIKNAEENNEKQVIVGRDQGREVKIRNIEDKVLTQFKTYQDKKEDLPYYLNNLLKNKLTKINREKKKSMGEVPKRSTPRTFYQKLEAHEGNLGISRRGTKTSSFVRRLDPSSLCFTERAT